MELCHSVSSLGSNGSGRCACPVEFWIAVNDSVMPDQFCGMYLAVISGLQACLTLKAAYQGADADWYTSITGCIVAHVKKNMF